ncbi:MAG: hypothetical protein K2O18_03135 [Oscillospiraceae bacterium]|nr:hypothetical protein [Oscillospiraceae bacterium]
MTKTELKNYLKAGGLMENAFVFCPGQECDIFKTDRFIPGDDIIYIPDLYLNEIPIDTPASDEKMIVGMIDCCYTGDDFIRQCGGDEGLAEQLFWFCDWQHPSSAYDEGIFEEEN